MDSCFAYLGAIVMILYALSMFGVNAITLVGGVGVMAVIFTLGANSLIADVLAGLFIIFEGDFIVGDVVVINDFRGVVTDVSIRTTKLMDDNSQDIKIISNSSIKELTNQSRQISTIVLDIPIGKSVGLEKGVPLLKDKLKVLPSIFPKIVGEVEYWGVSDFPSRNQMTGKYGGCKVRIALNCHEKDGEMLTYAVKEEMMKTFYLLTEKPADSETPEDPGMAKRKITKPFDLKNS